MLSIAAMVTVQNIFFSHEGEKKSAESAKRKFAVEEGDHLTLLNIYQAFVTHGNKSPKWSRDHYLNHRSLMRAVSVRSQLRRFLERFNIKVSDTPAVPATDLSEMSIGERIRRCLTTGYFAHAARMQPDGTFMSVNGGLALWAHPSSVMFNRRTDWVIFHEVVETGNKTFIRDVSCPILLIILYCSSILTYPFPDRSRASTKIGFSNTPLDSTKFEETVSRAYDLLLDRPYIRLVWWNHERWLCKGGNIVCTLPVRVLY